MYNSWVQTLIDRLYTGEALIDKPLTENPPRSFLQFCAAYRRQKRRLNGKEEIPFTDYDILPSLMVIDMYRMQEIVRSANPYTQKAQITPAFYQKQDDGSLFINPRCGYLKIGPLVTLILTDVVTGVDTLHITYDPQERVFIRIQAQHTEFGGTLVYTGTYHPSFEPLWRLLMNTLIPTHLPKEMPAVFGTH